MNTILTWTLLLTGVCIFPATAANQILLRDLDPADGPAQIITADRAGHLFVISTVTAPSGPPISRVVELDLNGSRVAAVDLGQFAPAAAVTDAQGDLILTSQAQVLKLDPQLKGTPFSLALPATIAAVAADASGNIYLTGYTSSTTLPVTADAYQSKPPGGDNFGKATYAFLTKLSPSGQILYSTYFGSDATSCNGGSACVGAFGSTLGAAIVLDPSGAVVIAGSTSASNLPATPGSLSQTCNCAYRRPTGFIAKFQLSAAQQLQWSTFLNADQSPLTSLSVSVSSMDLDAAGNVIIGGSAPSGLPTTPGAFQPSVIRVPGTADSGGFVFKLNRNGSSIIWGTYFGGSPFSFVRALRVDTQGRVLFTGVTVDPSKPALPTVPSFRPTYVARLSSDGASLVDYYTGPIGQGLALTATGGFAAVGQALWIETANPGPSLLSIVNSASGSYSDAVTRVELITLFGVGLGPSTPLNGQVQNGAFTTSLGGCQVLFDDVPAPLLYADSGQINAVVPRGVGSSARLQVVTPAGTIVGPTLPVSVQPIPGIFQGGTGMAVALNQDGSINSAANPARAGSIVTGFATGGGANFFPDGALVPIGIYNALATVWAGGARSYEVVFAGDAPGIVAGVMQINFRLPGSLPPGTTLGFNLIIGGVSTGSSQIAVTP